MCYVQVFLPFVTCFYLQEYFVLLCFTLLHFADNCVFYKLKVCGNPASSTCIGAVFLIACTCFMSLSHILAILLIFQTFSLLYLLWWSMIGDFDAIIIIAWGITNCIHVTADLIDKCCMCSICSTDQAYSSSPWASLFSEIQQYWN